MEKFYCLYANKSKDFWPETGSNMEANDGYMPEMIYCHDKKRDFFITDGENVRVVYIDSNGISISQFKELTTELLYHGLKTFALISERYDELVEAMDECTDRLDIDYDVIDSDCPDGLDEPPYIIQNVLEEKFLIICQSDFILKQKIKLLSKYGFEFHFAEIVDKIHSIMEQKYVRIFLRSGKVLKTTPLSIEEYEDDSGEKTYEDILYVTAPEDETMMIGLRNKDIQFFTGWDEEDSAKPKMNYHTAMYIYEHRLLPEVFFEDPVALSSAIANEKSMIFNKLTQFLTEHDIESNFSEEDFSINAQLFGKNIFVVEIKYPEPSESPLCFEQLLITNLDGTEKEFYCLEHPEEAGELPFLCNWLVIDGKDNIHGNLGRCSKEDFVKQAFTIYMDKYYKRIDEE